MSDRRILHLRRWGFRAPTEKNNALEYQLRNIVQLMLPYLEWSPWSEWVCITLSFQGLESYWLEWHTFSIPVPSALFDYHYLVGLEHNILPISSLEIFGKGQEADFWEKNLTGV
jgi:hypothetical protein